MTRYKKYTYTQIVKIVGYKVVSKWDNDQITIAQLVNHLAAHKNSGNYQQHAMERLRAIQVENPWQSDIEGFEKLPLNYGEEN